LTLAKILVVALLLTLLPASAWGPAPASAAASPAVTFASKGGNAWWVEAIVGGADAALVKRVDARDSYGPWVALTHEPWGTWGASFAIEPGHLVTFQATLSDGRVVASCAFEHPSGVPACGAIVPPAPGALAPFAASFAPKPGNAWWVETLVSANAPLASVTASVDGGAPVALAATSWGAWAKSFFVPSGATIRFAAISTGGARVESPTAYAWPSATPVNGTLPAPAPGVPAAPVAKAIAGVGSVALSWSTPANGGSPLTGYKVYRNGSLLRTLGVVTSLSDAGLAAGVAYRYQVSALNAVGEGNRSVEASATPLAPAPTPAPAPAPGGFVHTNIVSTTFWVGEIFNANLADGSQVCSTYDSQWAYHWSGVNNGKVPAGAAGCAGSIVGGCDGVPGASNACQTEKRTATNGYYPTSPLVHPKENPFYLDLPFDDLNDPIAFAQRCQVIPWANDPGFAGHCQDAGFSYMKNHWVKILGPNGNVCYGQVEDAGPSHGSLYHDAAYVFGTNDARPIQGQFNDAGMDVSPALNGCLGFAELDGQNDRVSWSFVDEAAVPPGPWKTLVTTSQASP